jgi:hypothetical protein
MTNPSRIYVDLMKKDDQWRVQLTTVGTRRDLARLGIELEEGMLLHLYTDDANSVGVEDNLVFDGIARFDATANIWVAEIDWGALRHESELRE